MMPTGPVAQVPAIRRHDGIPGGRTLLPGQNFEFEFGIFIDPASLDNAGLARLVLHRHVPLRDRRGRHDAEQPRLRPRRRGPLPDARARRRHDDRLAVRRARTVLRPDGAQHRSRRTCRTSSRGAASSTRTSRRARTASRATPCSPRRHGQGGPAVQHDLVRELPHQQRPRRAAEGAARREGSMVFKLYAAARSATSCSCRRARPACRAPRRRAVMLGDGTAVTLKRPNVHAHRDRRATPSHFSARARAASSIGHRPARGHRRAHLLARADRARLQRATASRAARATSKDPVTGVLRSAASAGRPRRSASRTRWPTPPTPTSASAPASSPIGGKAELTDADLMRLSDVHAPHRRAAAAQPRRRAGAGRASSSSRRSAARTATSPTS